LAGVLTRVLAHRTERDPESRESGYLPSFVNLQALLGRLSRICLSRMESAVSRATFSFASTWRRLVHWSGAGQADAHVKSRRAEPDPVRPARGTHPTGVKRSIEFYGGKLGLRVEVDKAPQFAMIRVGGPTGGTIRSTARRALGALDESS
jgi:hypothetical protein